MSLSYEIDYRVAGIYARIQSQTIRLMTRLLKEQSDVLRKWIRRIQRQVKGIGMGFSDALLNPF
jgi:hypothetical protein